MTDSSFSPGAVEGAAPGAATRLRDAAAKLRATALSILGAVRCRIELASAEQAVTA